MILQRRARRFGQARNQPSGWSGVICNRIDPWALR
jgi:hypothetical protein